MGMNPRSNENYIIRSLSLDCPARGQQAKNKQEITKAQPDKINKKVPN